MDGVFRLLHAKKSALLLFAYIIALTLIPISSSSAELYAPIKKWTVDNWYQGKPQFHQRWFSNARSAFYVDWEWYGYTSGGPEAPCRSGDIRNFELAGWEYYQAGNNNYGSLADAKYMLVECDGSSMRGPFNYGSAAIRHWACADGVWRDPAYNESSEICSIDEGVPEPELNKGAPPCADQCFGDPVNAGNGNKFENKIEYRGPGALPLDFSWTYNSSGGSAASDGVGDILGRFRSTTFSRSLVVSVSGDVESAYVSRPNGASVRFRKTNGSWASVSGLDESLSYSSDLQQWIFEDSAGRDYFDTTGRLVSIGDATGASRISLSYDQNGRISKALDDNGRSLTLSYDRGSRLDSLLLPDGGVIKFSYDAPGRLSHVIYPGGDSIGYLYDEQGFVSRAGDYGALTGVIDEDGRRYSSTHYDSLGRAVSTSLGGVLEESAVYTQPQGKGYATETVVSTSGGATRQMKFSVIGGRIVLTSRTESCPGCVTRQSNYSYDADGQLVSVQGGGIGEVRSYDTKGRVIRVADGVNSGAATRAVEFDWHPNFRVQTERRVLDHLGKLSYRDTWIHNDRGQVVTENTLSTDGSGLARSVSRIYCEAVDVHAGLCPRIGLMREINGPRVDVDDYLKYLYYQSDHPGCVASATNCAYRKGDLWKIENGLQHESLVLAYDGAGRPLSFKDSNGVITDYGYSARGWLIFVAVRGTNNESEADDRITRIDYWPTGLVKEITKPDGSYASYTYDAAHRLFNTTDSTGSSIKYTLDGSGNHIQADIKDRTGAFVYAHSRIYNKLNQLTTAADAAANATDFSYDERGNIISGTDAQFRVTRLEYDPLSRLTSSLQDAGGIAAKSSFAYDALDNITEVTDPKGLKTTYAYDGFGQLKAISSPDTGTTERTHDAAGNIKTSTDARGITVTYNYDALNRVTLKSYPSQGEDVSYTYDTAPTMCAAGESFAIGRLSSMVDGSGRTDYCYNRFGDIVRKAQTTNGKAFVVRYTYTTGGNLASVIYPDGAAADYVRDGQGRIVEVGVTSGSSGRQVLLTGASYLPFGPSTGWQYGNGRALVRSFDADYRPTAVVDSGHDLKIGLGYDTVGNITALESGSYAADLNYDTLGRLTEFRDSAANVAIEKYTYDTTGNRLSFANAGVTTPYDYDATSHRLTSVAGVSRSYDAVGNTISALSGAKSYIYNQANRLAQVKSGGATVQSYAYNARGERVQRGLDAASSVYTAYDEAGRWLGDYDSLGNATQQVVWMDDMPVGLLAEGVLHYIEPDHLGTPRLVFNPMRNVPVWTWDIKGEAFGDSVPNQDPDGDSQAFVFDMRLPGQRYDAASGLNYNYFRDYDSSSGRYVQSDPIGLIGGVSTFAYVGGNPISQVDPSGLIYGNGTFELEDAFFGPTYWMREQLGLDPSLSQASVDFAAGWGDSLTFNRTNWIREQMGANDAIDRCSVAYTAGHAVGTLHGFAVPAGRIGYVVQAKRISTAGLSAEASVAARNTLKDYYRGPFANILRNWHSVSYEGLVAAGKTDAQIIAGAGRTSIPWTIGIIGLGTGAASQRANQSGGGCGCGN